MRLLRLQTVQKYLSRQYKMSSLTQTDIIYQNATAESAEYKKIQSKIKQLWGINVSIESLKHMIFLYREIMKTR